MSSSIIQAANLRKTYEVGGTLVHALDGLDVQIEKGAYIALMGTSGSGKSTLMNVLGCLDTPTSGAYVLNGIGFVFQTFNLLPRYTALENVALPMIYAGIPKEERLSRAESVLHKVGLGDRMDHKPNELSGGQRQRVAVARALVMNPSIILADEPTGNLDSVTSDGIMELFGEINRDGNTVIVVTHEEDIAAHAERIIRLKDGRISE